MYSLYDKSHNFGSLNDIEKAKIIKFLKEPSNNSHWYVVGTMQNVRPHVHIDEFKNILTSVILTHKSSSSDDLIDLLIEFAGDNKKFVVDLINKSDSKQLPKVFLCMDHNEDEEVRGLRSMSLIKYPPSMIFKTKYQPTLEALKKLPPVMRLQALEAITNRKMLGYNPFGKIKDKDEFRSMLFGALLRYTDRIEQVWQKYQEYSGFGKDSLVKIKAECETCGEYSFSIASKCIRTFTGFKSSRLFWLFDNKMCTICGEYGKITAQVFLDAEGNEYTL